MPDAGFKDAKEMHAMWNRWWYDQFDFGLEAPENAREFEIEVDGERWDVALLEDAAPKTCQAWWDTLATPYEGKIIHTCFFGHCAYWLDRIDFPDVQELENRTTRFALGEFIWEPWLKEITFCYGRWGEVRFPTTPVYNGEPHPGQAILFARLKSGFNRFAQMCRRTRYEGAITMKARRKSV